MAVNIYFIFWVVTPYSLVVGIYVLDGYTGSVFRV